jgi:L-iditol 2-dehydrogenase
MRMKALQVVRPRLFKEVQIPVPKLPGGGGHILVRTAWGLTCGSDVAFVIGNKRLCAFPHAPGAPIHECSGEVVESTSDHFRPGDLVVAIPDGNMGLAEYFLAQESRSVVLNHDTKDLGAACILQPLSTVMNAMDRLADFRGKSFAVIGLGAIGLLFCWLAKRGGARSIVGIDPLQGRCRTAETLGASRTFCGRGIEAVHRARAVPDEWHAPDICVEAAGHQTETINDCLELVGRYGTVVAFGVPDQPVYAFNYEVFFRKNARLIACVTPDWTEYLPKARDLFLANRDVLSAFITHRLPMREAEKAFGMYERHEDGIVKAALDARSW